MIVTLTVNPAIDRNVTVDRLVFEDRAYINSSRESPGGRGINASCVIHSFGGKTAAVVTAGGAGRRGLSGGRFVSLNDGQAVAYQACINPDCGMNHLPRDVAFGKLSAMAEGARLARQMLSG